MQIPLAFGDYKGRSGAANATEMINMMVESDNQGGAAPYSIIGTPGLEVFCDTGKVAEGRGGYTIPGSILAVVGNTFFHIDASTGDRNQIGTIGTTTGAVQWAENPDEVMMIDGSAGYVYTKATKGFAEITDADFPTPKDCAWKDGYGVVVKTSTGQLYVSAINDFTSWDALDFTTAEFKPDNLVGCYAAHDSLIAFGEKTVQFYYNSGNSSYPFDNRQGANLQIGCAATDSVAGGENVVLWLDNTGVVRMLTSYAPERVSTPQVEYRIAQTVSSEARGSFYSQEGHSFYALTFPSEDYTLVYDLTTGQWHKRTSYPNHVDSSSRYRCNWIVQDDTSIFGGDFQNGIVYKLDPGVYQENSQPVRWFTTSQNVNSDRKMVSHRKLEIHLDSGVGLYTGQGSDPQLWMQYSDDDGHNWSREKWASMGKLGDFDCRARWYNLGMSRSRVYRFGGSDPVRRNIVSAHVEGEALGY